MHSLSLGVDIPLRIFDRNQGEKRKTLIDITRNEQLTDANRTLVTSDVDSAYATMMSNVALLRPYKDTYLDQSLARARHHDVLVSERRRVAHRLSPGTAGLPKPCKSVRQSGRGVSERRRPS